MRRVVAALAVVALLLTGCDDDSAAKEPASKQLPSLSLDAFGSDSEPLQLADVRGPAVINLWASWCQQCIAELPVLEDFSQQYAGRVDVIGVDFQDAQGEKAAQMIERAGVTYPLYEDFDGDLNDNAPFPILRGLPFTAFVDAQGRVVHQEFGAVDDVAELGALVEQHLGVSG